MSNSVALDAPERKAHESSPTDVEVREALVNAAMRTLRHTTFHEVTYDLVVADSGVQPDIARRQFPTWDDLVLATLHAWNAKRMASIASIASIAEQFGAVAFLRAIVLANVQDPALMRFVAAMAPVSATPGHPMAPHLQRQWIVFHASVQRALIHDIAIGREPDTMDPARGAEQLIAMYEGLQLQSMARAHLDVVDAFDRGITALRDGWSLHYHQAVWDI